MGNVLPAHLKRGRSIVGRECGVALGLENQRQCVGNALLIVGDDNQRSCRIGTLAKWRLGQKCVVHTASLKSSVRSSSCLEGKKTVNTVQLWPDLVLLFTRIEPWWRSTIPLQTQRPNP